MKKIYFHIFQCPFKNQLTFFSGLLWPWQVQGYSCWYVMKLLLHTMLILGFILLAVGNSQNCIFFSNFPWTPVILTFSSTDSPWVSVILYKGLKKKSQKIIFLQFSQSSSDLDVQARLLWHIQKGLIIIILYWHKVSWL